MIDPLLGIPIELCDLSKYTEEVRQSDIAPEDNSLISNPTRLEPSNTARVQHLQHKSHENKVQKIEFHRSPHFESKDDTAITEQLKYAFNGDIPEGEVSTIKKGEQLVRLFIRGSEFLNSENYHLLTKPLNEETYIKVVSDKGGEVSRSYTVQEQSEKYAYLMNNENGEYVLGNIYKSYALKSMPPKATKENEYTARPVKMDFF